MPAVLMRVHRPLLIAVVAACVLACWSASTASAAPKMNLRVHQTHTALMVLVETSKPVTNVKVRVAGKQIPVQRIPQRTGKLNGPSFGAQFAPPVRRSRTLVVQAYAYKGGKLVAQRTMRFSFKPPPSLPPPPPPPSKR